MNSLASPYFLLLLLLLPLFLEEDLSRKILGSFLKKRQAVDFAATSQIGALPASPRQRLRSACLSILLLGAFICGVLALARPQFGQERSTINASGRDIMLVLDVSKSMDAMDFFISSQRVNRLHALKHVAVSYTHLTLPTICSV